MLMDTAATDAEGVSNSGDGFVFAGSRLPQHAGPSELSRENASVAG